MKKTLLLPGRENLQEVRESRLDDVPGDSALQPCAPGSEVVVGQKLDRETDWQLVQKVVVWRRAVNNRLVRCAKRTEPRQLLENATCQREVCGDHACELLHLLLLRCRLFIEVLRDQVSERTRQKALQVFVNEKDCPRLPAAVISHADDLGSSEWPALFCAQHEAEHPEAALVKRASLALQGLDAIFKDPRRRFAQNSKRVQGRALGVMPFFELLSGFRLGSPENIGDEAAGPRGA